jgi:flagellar basal body-associated protein FliL
MHRYNSISLVAVFFLAAVPALAATTTATSTEAFPSVATTTATSTATTTLPVLSFCDRVEVLTTNIRTDAAMKAADHRVDLEKLSSEREEEKKKLGEARAVVRQKEDIARDALIEIFRTRAVTAVAKEAVEHFSTSSGKILKELRIASDKAREDYAKVTRSVSLTERTKRNKALDSYIDKLDAANEYAEEQCAKGAKDTSVMAAYNMWLKSAKDELAKNLKLKKSTLEQRAREVHERELARLESEYRRKMQRELELLTDKFPELFESPAAVPVEGEVQAPVDPQVPTEVPTSN